MADLKLNTTNGSVTLKPEDGSGNVDVTIPRVGVGKVINVYQAEYSERYSAGVTANSWNDFPSLSLTVVPNSSNSKFLISAQIGRADNSTYGMAYRILRDSTPIGVGDAYGSNPRASAFSSAIGRDNNHSSDTIAFQHIDSPSTTDSITYKIQFMSEGTTVYLNRAVSQSSATASTYLVNTVSSIIITEISN